MAGDSPRTWPARTTVAFSPAGEGIRAPRGHSKWQSPDTSCRATSGDSPRTWPSGRWRFGSPTARSTSPGSRGRTCRRCGGRGSTRGSSSSTAGSCTPRPTGRSSGTARCRGGSPRSSRRCARLLPQTDVFHFYFGLTLVPPSLQFPILRARAARGASSTTSARTSAARPRPSSPTGSARTRRSSAPTTRSAGCPRRTSSRPGSTCARSRRTRRPTAPARSSSTRRRTARRRAPRYVIEACEQLPVELDIVEGVTARGGTRALRARRHRRRPAERRLARRLRARGDGARQAGRRAPQARTSVERSAEGYGIRVPIVPATKETLVDALRPLVESPALRRELGAESRAYVEQVHDIDRVADRLIDIYARSSGARRASSSGSARSRRSTASAASSRG